LAARWYGVGTTIVPVAAIAAVATITTVAATIAAIAAIIATPIIPAAVAAAETIAAGITIAAIAAVAAVATVATAVAAVTSMTAAETAMMPRWRRIAASRESCDQNHTVHCLSLQRLFLASDRITTATFPSTENRFARRTVNMGYMVKLENMRVNEAPPEIVRI
jgi:hypothetical protein